MNTTTSKPAPKHLTREHQQYARSHVKRRNLRIAGRRGAARTRELYGDDFFFNAWRKWKLTMVSEPERIVIGLLGLLKLRCDQDYIREHRLRPSLLSLDFYFDHLNKGIEVHGKIHSTLKRKERQANDKRKRALCAEQGIEVLWIRHRELNNVPKLFQKLQSFFHLGAK